MNVWVSAHAAERFAERVRPGLARKDASVELGRLVREFGRVVEWPAWAHMERTFREGQFAVEICDGVIVVCEPKRGGGSVAVTVKTRCGAGPEHVNRGARRRAARRAKRLGGQKHLDRAARLGVRASREPRADEAI